MALDSLRGTQKRSRGIRDLIFVRPNYHVPATDIERFERYILPEPNSGCFLWTGATYRNGYAMFTPRGGPSQLAHRYAYKHYVGPITEYSLDHKCRVRCCVNPAHLEPVSQRVNVLRGVGIPAVNAAKTHCKHGHEFDKANTYIAPKTGERHCRVCRNALFKKRKAAERAKMNAMWGIR